MMGILDWIKGHVVDPVAKTIEEKTGVDIPYVGHTKESEQSKPKEQSPPATTTYYYATSDKSGETVVVEAKSAKDVVSGKGKVVAKGVEAEAMVKKASGQIWGYRTGRHGGSGSAYRARAENLKKARKSLEKKRAVIESAAEQLESQAKALEKEAAQLEVMRERVEKTKDPQIIQEYNRRVTLYNQRVTALQEQKSVLERQINDYNQKAKSTYLAQAYVSGALEGYQRGKAERYDPVNEELKRMREMYKKNALAGLAHGFAINILSRTDPLGLRSIYTYVTEQFHGKTPEEAKRDATRIRAEASLELKQKWEDGGSVELVKYGATSPFAMSAVGSIAVGSVAGTTAGAVARVSPKLATALTVGYAAGGATLATGQIVDPLISGDVPTALTNATLLAFAYPGAKYGWARGWKVGYTGVDTVRSKVELWKAQQAARSEIDSINDAFEGAGIKPTPKSPKAQPPIQKQTPNADFYQRILSLDKYRLSKIDTSRMLKAYETLRAQGKTAEAQAIYDKIQAIETAKQMKGAGVPELPKAKPRGAMYDSWVDQMISRGREYYSGIKPYIERVVELQKQKKGGWKITSVKSPHEYASGARLSYFSGPRDYISPAEMLGLDRMVGSSVRYIPMLEPTLHPMVIQKPRANMLEKPGTKVMQGVVEEVTPMQAVRPVADVGVKQAELIGEIEVVQPIQITKTKSMRTAPPSSPNIPKLNFEPPAPPEPIGQDMFAPIGGFDLPMPSFGRKSRPPSRRRRVEYAERYNPVATWEGIADIAEGFANLFGESKPRRRRRRR